MLILNTSLLRETCLAQVGACQSAEPKSKSVLHEKIEKCHYGFTIFGLRSEDIFHIVL